MSTQPTPVTVGKTKEINALLNLIKTWIETESGPTHATFSIPNLQVRIKLRGWKKIILERTSVVHASATKRERR